MLCITADTVAAIISENFRGYQRNSLNMHTTGYKNIISSLFTLLLQFNVIYLYNEEIKKPCYSQIVQKVLNRFTSK